MAAPTQAPRNFREWAWNISPGSWRGFWGSRFIKSVALVFDTIVEGAQQAVYASSLSHPDVAPDALDYIGLERNLPRFPGETTPNYNARLREAWNLWRQAGTRGGLMAMFSALGITAEIKGNADWDWDGDTANWSRLWVVLTGHNWQDDGVWGDPGTWGDGGTWGSNATPDEVRAVRHIVRMFKAAHSICAAICVVLDPDAWAIDQPDGTWGAPENRSDSAIYWSA